MLDELSLTLADLGWCSEGKTEFVIQPKPSRAEAARAGGCGGMGAVGPNPSQDWEWDPSHAHISSYKRRMFALKHLNFWGKVGLGGLLAALRWRI